MHEQIPLSDSIISQIADQYQKEVELEEIFQNDKRNQIKELTQLIINSINKPIYELLYKEEYGDYWEYRDWETDRKSTRLNSSHSAKSRMPSSA